MSLSPSIGVVGPSHWTYAAAVMADRLGKVITEQRVTTGLIPEGVYRGIKRFFLLVLNPDGNQIPAANIANCLIAANALARSRETPPRNLLEFDQILNEYSRFVNSLADEREVTPNEIQKAEELRKFFKQLEQDGETDAYEKLVRWDAPSFSR
jgi:hypothetical protein